MEKIIVAELLKDCPTGMELDCTMFEKPVKYTGLTNGEPYIITIKTPCGRDFYLTKEGYLYDMADSKCIIFPKGKTTWEGFVPPCKFKDGDVLYVRTSNQWICIYKEGGEQENVCHRYVAATSLRFVHDDSPLCHRNNIKEIRLATEEEKAKLFDAIKENGYKWNAESKTLEKLIEPQFKVGDRIRHKEKTKWTCVIRRIDDRYWVDEHPMCYTLPFGKQDEYELVPNKFDITTLKPFDSRVLVRDSIYDEWKVSFWGCMSDCDRDYKYDTVRGYYKCCIPYESNEHLLGKTEDCDEYYKTWE